MAHFHDNQDHRWSLDITFDAVRRVKQLTGVNLVELADAPGSPPDSAPGSATGSAPDASAAPTLTRLGVDIVLLVDVIFSLVKPQADERGISDEDFGRALGGEAIAAARAAFWEALTDFSRSLGRSDQVQAIRKQEQVVRAAIAAADQQIEQIDVDEAISQAFGDSLTNSPGPSASTPDL